MQRALPALSLVSCLLLAAACSSEKPPLPRLDPATKRATSHGEVVGFTSEAGAHVWRGIPFATPPVGELRWRAPQPAEPWEGTREALEFGASCVQFAGPMVQGDAEEGTVTGSEDCLYLNVFAPPFDPGEVPVRVARRPVMVWIHGGGNSIGDTTFYDASRLAREREVVVVSVHYRLGVLGWFTHPALREGESWQDASGNYGTLDLVRALHWVQRNIEVFGGDPERVTIFGESAGGLNVFGLLLSPAARGRFQRAIAQSGSAYTSTLAEAENYADAAEPGDPGSSREVMLQLLENEGRASSRAAARQTLDGMSTEDIAAWLRGKPAAELLAVFEDTDLGGMYESPQLIRDGRVLPKEDPHVAFARPGRTNEVPVIFGTNRDENKLFLLFDSPYVRRLGPLPLGLNDERMFELTSGYASLMWKARGADDPAAAVRRVRDDVWVYRFDWDDERQLLWLDLPKLLGASHGLEVPFVFGTLSLGGAERFVFDRDHAEADRRLADAITSYWTRFAATGHPGKGREGELPDWEPWGGPRGSFLILDSEDDAGIRMTDDTVSRDGILAQIASDPRFESAEERCEVYRDFVIWARVLSRDAYAAIDDGACAPFPLPKRGSSG